MIAEDYPFLGRIIAYELLDKIGCHNPTIAVFRSDDSLLKYNTFGFYAYLYLSNGEVLAFAYDVKEPPCNKATTLDRMREELLNRGKVVFAEFKRVMMKAGLKEESVTLDDS